MLDKICAELQSYADPEKAVQLQRFFKTGKGDYGEGDVFIGVRVPAQRVVAKKYRDAPLDVVAELLKSSVHEHRLTGALLLTYKYERADDEYKKEIVDFYLANTSGINNWDLVDLTAPKILGDWLIDKDRKILYDLVNSKDLWEKRISILSTYAFIRENDFDDTLKISEILLYDKHDLIHKAVGWMLREVGNRDQAAEVGFLNKHVKKMPRTMLRYAIERFDEELRQKYMKM